MTAGIENLLEEIVLQCLPQEQEALLTASVLEHAIATNGDLWGLLQPYAHLNAGRTSSGKTIKKLFERKQNALKCMTFI